MPIEVPIVECDNSYNSTAYGVIYVYDSVNANLICNIIFFLTNCLLLENLKHTPFFLCAASSPFLLPTGSTCRTTRSPTHDWINASPANQHKLVV